jgi:gluconokinase
MSPLVKLLWFRQEQPEVWRRVAHRVGIKEYVLLRLAGLLAVDESVASATGLYNLGVPGLERRGAAPDRGPA